MSCLERDAHPSIILCCCCHFLHSRTGTEIDGHLSEIQSGQLYRLELSTTVFTKFGIDFRQGSRPARFGSGGLLGREQPQKLSNLVPSSSFAGNPRGRCLLARRTGLHCGCFGRRFQELSCLVLPAVDFDDGR